jgi:lipoprotein-anchoring transpeptidase ErfK/SrfK
MAEVGVCMRIGALSAAALMFVAASPAIAKLKFSSDTFQLYGGIDNTPERQDTKRYRGKRNVSFESGLPPGSVVVRTGERKLYYVLPDGRAIQYAVGVGREGFEWSGRNRISRKQMWPDWRPPEVMLEREHAKGHMIPDYMPGGVENPLGARALYIGATQYRIHGTAQPWSIGLAVSSGCIRMLNEEVIDLYNRVKIGALVVVE